MVCIKNYDEIYVLYIKSHNSIYFLLLFKMEIEHTYMTIDFECFQPNIWQSVGIIVVRNNKCIDHLELACERDIDTIPYKTMQFWNRHKKAFNYNIDIGVGYTCQEQEIKICNFIANWKKMVPNFYMVVDNPEYDISLLNDILTRNGHDVISKRSQQVYFQSICTWSSKRILKLLGISLNVYRDKNFIVDIPEQMVRHTPVADCIRIMNSYLNMMRIIRNFHSINVGVQY